MTHHSETTGSCWNEAPFGPGQSNGLLCELPHGHKGAHRAGDTEWMIPEDTRMPEPQSEPSDAQVIAALNAYWEYDPPVTEVGYWSAKHASIMRAALRAASAATDRGGNHG